MSYYHFNRKEILQKAKERYSKEKAAEYCLPNKEAINENNIKTVYKSNIKTFQKKKSTRLKNIKEIKDISC